MAVVLYSFHKLITPVEDSPSSPHYSETVLYLHGLVWSGLVWSGLFVCLFVCLFACLLTCLFACLLTCLFACLLVWIVVC